jgi:rhodanese-related sulfurtransferase
VALAVVLAFAAAACAGDAGPAAEALDVGATVIDVRTPEEFAEGHVEGATLIDIQGADFEAQVDALDPEATYVVYCRSGNRSARAAAMMRDAGLEVIDGGALGDMESAGWPVTS